MADVPHVSRFFGSLAGAICAAMGAYYSARNKRTHLTEASTVFQQKRTLRHPPMVMHLDQAFVNPQGDHFVSGFIGALAGAICTGIGAFCFSRAQPTRATQTVVAVQQQRALKQAPKVGTHLDEAFLPRLRHNSVTMYRKDYQNFRQGKSRGAHGEVGGISVGEQEAPGVWGEGDGDGNVSNMPAIFEVDRHLEAGTVLTNRPEIIEELQSRINTYRLQYRQLRQGSATGTRITMEKMLKLLHSAPVDIMPTTHLATLRRQKRRFATRSLRKPSPSEANLQNMSQVQGLHVHFGAGRLAGGLVLPAICKSGCPFAIINPPFDEFKPFIQKHKWQRSSGGNLVILQLNGEVYGQLVMVTGVQDLPFLERFLESLDSPDYKPGPGIFAITDDKQLLHLLISKAKTFSTSVGPGLKGVSTMIREVLPNWGHLSRALLPSCSCCENDHHAVEEFEGEVKGYVAVASCLVDRICTGRTLFVEPPEEGSFPEHKCEPSLVRITSEPWSGLIMIPPFPDGVFASRCPFAGDSVLRPKLPVEAEYITRRKINIVNGMHTTLSFLTLHAHAQTQGDEYTLSLENDKLVEPEAQLILLTVDKADAKTEKIIWSWAVARQLLLAFETGIEVMISSHSLDNLPAAQQETELCKVIWKYTSECVLRFNGADDTCGRVLGGGVVNRMRTRLRPVSAFLEQTPDLEHTLGGFPKKLMAVAGVQREEMYKHVAELSAIAERLVGKV